MAHTLEKTMLADMGFADPDKNPDGTTHPEHDRAIEYLTQPHVVTKLAEILCPSKGMIDLTYSGIGTRYLTHTPQEEQFGDFSAEVPIVQQEKGFRRFVGFLDAIMSVAYDVKTEVYDRSRKLTKTTDTSAHRYVIVEIKVRPTTTANIIRQVQLYRKFIDYLPESELEDKDPFWLVATRYAITDTEVGRLRQEHIHHVRLGTPFEKWLTEKRAKDHNVVPIKMIEI